MAIPVSQLRAVPRKDNKLLLHHVLVCSWLEFRRFTSGGDGSLAGLVYVLYVG